MFSSCLFSYREVAEPAVTVSNLPNDYSEEDLQKLFATLKPYRVVILPPAPSSGKGVGVGRQALVVLGGNADMHLAVDAFDSRVVKGHKLSVTPTPLHDIGK